MSIFSTIMETAISIRNKLMSLSGDDRLDASYIKNIPVASDNATGFSTRPTLTWTDTSPARTLTITGSHNIYINGTLYTKGSTSVQITDVTGIHWIYYNSSGILVCTPPSSGFPGFNQCLMAAVYWNSSAGKGVVSNETHGYTMDASTHEYLHQTVGVRYDTGLTGTFGNTTFTVTAGSIYDEDLKISITPNVTTASKFYRDASLNWTWTTKSALPYYTGHYYDNAGTLTPVTSNRYYAVWVFATNDLDNPIIIMLGQREDTTIANARANNTYESLSFGTLPYKEMKVLYRVIYRNDATPYEETQDLRSVSNLPSGTYVATDHGVLTGLADDDHLQYPVITSQYGSPAVAPARIGAISVDPNFSGHFFYGTGSSTSADWKRLINWVVSSATTTDATETLAFSLAVAANRLITSRIIVHCATADGATQYHSDWMVAYDDDEIIGSPTGNEITKGTRGTIAVRFDVSSSAVKVYVTGKAATTLFWSVFHQKYQSALA